MPLDRKSRNTAITLVLLLAAFAAFLAFKLGVFQTGSVRNTPTNAPTANENAPGPDTRPPEVVYGAYFQERLVALGIKDVGHPIEGFDATLLIIAFPGLIEADFDGVATFEGHYEFKDGGLVHVRDREQPVSSAERTVSDAGYIALLANVSARLGIAVASEIDVDAIIVRIDTGERIETKIGHGETALGVRIEPLELLEDSRCPEDVQCVWAGTVRVRVRVTTVTGETEQEFTLGEPVLLGGAEVTLTSVEPSPRSDSQFPPSTYRFHFAIKKL